MTESIAPTPTEQFLSKYRHATIERDRAYRELRDHFAEFIGHTVAISGYPRQKIMTAFGQNNDIDRRETHNSVNAYSLFDENRKPCFFEPAVVSSLDSSTMRLNFPYDVPPPSLRQSMVLTGCVIPFIGILSIVDIDSQTQQ